MLIFGRTRFVEELVDLGSQVADPGIGDIVKARREIRGSVADHRVWAAQCLEMPSRRLGLRCKEGDRGSLHGSDGDLGVGRHDSEAISNVLEGVA